MRGPISLAAALLALALAGCAGTATTHDPAPADGPAVDNQAVPTSADFPVLTSVDLAETLSAAMSEMESVTIDFRRSVQAPSESAKMHLSGVINVGDAGLDVDVAMMTDLPGVQGHLILVDGALYVFGAWAGERGIGDDGYYRWIRIERDDPTAPQPVRAMFDQLRDPIDPGVSTPILLATSELRPLGVEMLGLDEVMRHEGTVDVARGLQRISDGSGREFLETLDGIGVATASYEILVDRDHVLRELRLAYREDQVRISVVAKYSFWGRSRTVRPPDEYVTWVEAGGVEAAV